MISSRQQMSDNISDKNNTSNVRVETMNPLSPSSVRARDIAEKKISNYEEAWDIKLARLGIKSIDSMWTIEGAPKKDSTLKFAKDDQDPDSGHQKSSTNCSSSCKSNMGNSSSDSLSSQSLTDEWDEKRSFQVSPAIPPRLRLTSNSATQTDLPNARRESNPPSQNFTKSIESPFPQSHQQAIIDSSIPRYRRHAASENSSQVPIQLVNGSSHTARKHSKCNPMFHGQMMARSGHESGIMSQSVIVNTNQKLKPYLEEDDYDEENCGDSLKANNNFLNNTTHVFCHERARNLEQPLKRPSLRRAISYGPSQNSRILMQRSWMSNFEDIHPFIASGDNDDCDNNSSSYFGTCDQMQMNFLIDGSNMNHSIDKNLSHNSGSMYRRQGRRSDSVSSSSSKNGYSRGFKDSISFVNLKNHLFGIKDDEDLTKKSWFHSKMTRQESEEILKNSPPGSYLVRRSESNKSGYSLSVKCSREFLHMKIVLDKLSGKYILGEFSKPYRSIGEMIKHYSVNLLPIRGSSPILLKYPCCSLNIS